MNLSKQHIAIISGVFGLYACATLLILGSFDFIQSEGIVLPLVVSLISFILLSAFGLILSMKSQGLSQRMLLPSSFVFVALITSMLILQIFGVKNYTSLFILTFGIVGLVPGLIALFYSVLLDVKRRMQEPNKVKEKLETEVPFFEIRNAKNRLEFKEEINRIAFFESDDNYVVVHYFDDEENRQRSVQRMTLKNVEQELESCNCTDFRRVHKSYLIHHSFVDIVEGKSQAYRIVLKGIEEQIPVSRNFDICSLEA